MNPEFSEGTQAADAKLSPPLHYITLIADLITRQRLLRESGGTDAESPAYFHPQIKTLADQALPLLQAADHAEHAAIQKYLGDQEPQVGEQVLQEIKDARLRTSRKNQPKRRTIPRPRQGG